MAGIAIPMANGAVITVRMTTTGGSGIDGSAIGMVGGVGATGGKTNKLYISEQQTSQKHTLTTG